MTFLPLVPDLHCPRRIYRTAEGSLKNNVIGFTTLGEICLRVIDDVIGPNFARHVHVPGTAYGSYFSTEGFGDLHRKSTYAARRSINENLLTGLNLSFITKALQSSHCRYRYGGCCLKR